MRFYKIFAIIVFAKIYIFTKVFAKYIVNVPKCEIFDLLQTVIFFDTTCLWV
jgi:hypothetical protein